ncbi:MAG: aldo/keto reductase [Acidobacteriota bacterium]|nr:MAG: aldo/keto reductase [Acidobacteriota bacterium]
MSKTQFNRRQFVAGSAAVLGLGTLVSSETKGQAETAPEPSKILNYDERMEYRRLGKTGWMVSAISLGGHWKRLGLNGPAFEKNRIEVVAKCVDSGFNYIDACWNHETVAYAQALRASGHRDKVYLGFSSGEKEMRFKEYRTKKALLKGYEESLLEAGIDYADLWRVTCLEPGRMHTFGEVFEMIEAGEQAIKDGKCRAFGLSSHDRRWMELMVKSFPTISVILMPYTARSKRKPKGSLFDAVREHDIGMFGIKPFASNSMFKGDSQPGNPHEEGDNERARQALRYILTNDAISAPIPGLISIPQVDNCLAAIAERRKLDLQAKESGILQDDRLMKAADEMWKRLPSDYRWLREWEWV